MKSSTRVCFLNAPQRLSGRLPSGDYAAGHDMTDDQGADAEDAPFG
jgi:hypothetical protein